MFVIWEPVLVTDWVKPGAALTSSVADKRAEHFWDRNRRLSALFGGAAKLPHLAETEDVGFRMKDVVWDAALIYPPGVRWGSRAKLLVAPVVNYRDQLAGAL